MAITETTSQSWGGRLVESIKGVLFGLVLFVVSFPLLFWNEGRAVRTAQSLKEGAGAVISVAADSVAPANEGKLVHVTGEATTQETLQDPDFGVQANALKLIRRAEMYQWKEDKRSETKKKLGGGTETVTTYNYDKTWSSSLIDSSSFKQQEGHENPGAMPMPGQEWVASKVSLGAFTLSPEQVGRIDKSEPLAADDASKVSEPLRARVKPEGGGYYIGADPAAPAIGDARIRFAVVRPTTVSLVARQAGGTFEAYQAKAGDRISLLELGTHSAEEMFKAAEAANAALTWILRLVGFFLMFLGLVMMFRPFTVLADVIPFLGSLLGVGVGLFAGLVAFALSVGTIAVSWLFFRPLLGIGLLLVAVAGIAWLISLSVKKRKEKAAARPSAVA